MGIRVAGPAVGSRVLGMFMGFAVTELVVDLGVVDLEVGLVVGIFCITLRDLGSFQCRY